MSKENILFSIVGVLLGFIVGFTFANTVNQRGVAPTTQTGQQLAGLPPDHPPVAGVGQTNVDMTALRETEKLAQDSPDNFDAQLKAGELNYEAHRYNEAVNFWTRANRLRPDDYDLLVGLGNACFDAEQFESAERWYAAALAKRPDVVEVRTDYGLTFMLREPANLERAITEFKRSLAISPQHAQTLQNLAVAYTRKGEAAQAQATVAKLEAVNPNNTALASLKAEVDKLRAPAR
jgi:tetratricopeptide (TPR) repeat protein